MFDFYYISVELVTDLDFSTLYKCTYLFTYDVSLYDLLVGSHMRAIDWYQNLGLLTVFKLTPKPQFCVKTDLNWNHSIFSTLDTVLRSL